MMKRFPAFLLWIFLTTLSLFGQIRTITAAADFYPPFLDPKRKDGGLSMAIVRAAYATQGYKVSILYMPWIRAETSVRAGEIDILPDAWLTSARMTGFLFSKPYAVNVMKFIKRKGDMFEYSGLESLRGKTIGTMRGYGYGSDFLESSHFTREDTADFYSNIQKLILNRIDLTLEDEIVARSQIEMKNPEDFLRIEFCEKPLSINPIYVCSGNGNPRRDEIINAFNAGLAEIKANKTYARIMASYGIQ